MTLHVYDYRQKYEGPAAAFYDQDHSWRDYEAQSRMVASLLERSFGRTAKSRSAKILDLCCGSGSHSVPLAKRGFAVTGVDRSAPLLLQANRKARLAGVKARFIRRDMYALGSDKKFQRAFDACILLGWTLSIRPVYRRFGAILKLAQTVLKPGGLFIFDVPLDSNVNRSNPPQLRYQSAPQVFGTLSIREEASPALSATSFFYSWNVTDGRSSREFVVKEVLSRVRFAEIERAVAKSRFGSFEFLGGYDLDKKYVPGDPHLTGVLKKNVSGH